MNVGRAGGSQVRHDGRSGGRFATGGTLEAIADNLSDLSGRYVCDGFALTPATFLRGRGVFRKGYYGVRRPLRHPSTVWVAILVTATSAAAPN
jgi:hypothetical protein